MARSCRLAGDSWASSGSPSSRNSAAHRLVMRSVLAVRKPRGGIRGRGTSGRGGLDPEARSLADFGLDRRVAAHPFHALPDDRQTDAGPGILLLLVEALEDAEDAVVVAGIDADAVVL